jgi:hypothetical protein
MHACMDLCYIVNNIAREIRHPFFETRGDVHINDNGCIEKNTCDLANRMGLFLKVALTDLLS